jgi:hypothetical protein
MRKPSWPVAVERARDAARDAVLAVDGEESVAVDAQHEGRGGDPSQRLLDAAPVAADVVRVHGLDERHVGVRVEAARELVAVEV